MGEGSMGTDTKGLTVYGGYLAFEGNNKIDKIQSDYGSAVGIHLMHDAEVSFIQNTANIEITSNIVSGIKVTKQLLTNLIKENKYPFPNNFYECNILLDQNENDHVSLHPNPPNGVKAVQCRQNAVVRSLGIPQTTKAVTAQKQANGLWLIARYKQKKSHSSSSSSLSSSSSSSSKKSKKSKSINMNFKIDINGNYKLICCHSFLLC